MPNRQRVLVYTPQQLGGVRHVTESLANGIEHNGRAVRRAHTLADVIRARGEGVCEAILSLEAGYLAWLFPRSIYILHGFPFVGVQSPVRRTAARLAARLAKRSGSRLVAVSYLTRAVYERLYGIAVDAVIFNGCSESLVARASATGPVARKHKYITYVGRLVHNKGLTMIVESFLASGLPGLGYQLNIAGDGPLLEWAKEQAARRHEVVVLGEISESQKEDLLFESEAFVSLNDFEPMGVVFVEAVLTGCKIVAPYCGGHREFIPPDHPIALCDPSNSESVRAAFDRIPQLAARDDVAVNSAFSYCDRIAPAYLAILNGQGASARA